MSNRPIIYIAVIDDEETVCRSLSRFLRAAMLQPIAYASAEAFLADAKHPKFDCLVLDIQLNGGMSGLELRQRLAGVKDPTPVVFITAHDSPEVHAQAQELGCAGYFRKTTPGSEILSAIRQAVGIEAPDCTCKTN